MDLFTGLTLYNPTPEIDTHLIQSLCVTHTLIIPFKHTPVQLKGLLTCHTLYDPFP